MDKLTLVVPNTDWEKEILAYKEAFSDQHLYGGSRLQETPSQIGRAHV